MSDTRTMGQFLRELRKQRRLTLKDVSEWTGLSVSHLSAIERGVARPSFDSLADIANTYGLEPYIVFDERIPDEQQVDTTEQSST